MLAKASHSEIWTLLQSGNHQALLALYNAHYIGLMNYGMKLTGNRELTYDCITQILLRLWDTREKLPPVENVRSYLLTCLRRELMASLKLENSRQSRLRDIQKLTDHCEQSYEECLIQLQTSKAVQEKLTRALEKLTGREKELLKMKFFDDMDYDEIAATCNITKRTAYNIIHAAIKTLKAEFVHHSPLTIVYNKAMITVAIISLLAGLHLD